MNNRKKIADIQILRALAIIFVLFQHLSITATVAEKFPVHFNLPFYIAVELFFIISGYVVSKSLFTGEINPIHFLLKRVFRLYPVLILFILLGLAINFTFKVLELPDYTSKLFILSWSDFTKLSIKTLLGSYINNNEIPSNAYVFGAVWSLSVEFQFYTIVAAISFILTYIFKQSKKIELFLFIAFCLLYILTNTIRFLKLFNQFDCIMFDYFIKWNFDFLFIGFILSIAETRGWIRKFICMSREVSLFISPLLITLPLGLIAVSNSPFSTDKIILQGFTLPFAGICFTILVYLAATVGCFPGIQSSLYKVLYWLGERSYSIYLFHFPVMALAWILIYKLFPFVLTNANLYALLQTVITIFLLIPLVEIAYLKIETPSIRYCRKILKLNN